MKTKTINADAVNAVLVDFASQQRKHPSTNSNRQKNCSPSSKLRTPKSEDLKNLRESYLEPPLPFPNNTKVDQTNADRRLNEFMQGERTTIIDGEEHTYDPEAMRNYTLEEVGSIMGVTRERIRQIEEMALRKMWRSLDIMSKREGMAQSDWMEILTNAHGNEDTIYMP